MKKLNDIIDLVQSDLCDLQVSDLKNHNRFENFGQSAKNEINSVKSIEKQKEKI